MEVNDNPPTEGIGPQDEKLGDLPVADEQSAETRGGGAPNGKLYVATDVGVFVSDR
jgi:hypothetical protein